MAEEPISSSSAIHNSNIECSMEQSSFVTKSESAENQAGNLPTPRDMASSNPSNSSASLFEVTPSSYTNEESTMSQIPKVNPTQVSSSSADTTQLDPPVATGQKSQLETSFNNPYTMSQTVNASQVQPLSNDCDNSSEMVPDPSFTSFDKLPTEIRLKIWRHALPDPRVIEIFHKPTLPNYTTPTRTPAILHVSAEARVVALKYDENLKLANMWYSDAELAIQRLLVEHKERQDQISGVEAPSLEVDDTSEVTFNTYIDRSCDLLYFPTHFFGSDGGKQRTYARGFLDDLKEQYLCTPSKQSWKPYQIAIQAEALSSVLIFDLLESCRVEKEEKHWTEAIHVVFEDNGLGGFSLVDGKLKRNGAAKGWTFLNAESEQFVKEDDENGSQYMSCHDHVSRMWNYFGNERSEWEIMKTIPVSINREHLQTDRGFKLNEFS